MNHWAIGLIDGSSVITVPESVLRPISISVGSMVWGMFYPESQTSDRCHLNPEIDFVFSSIPFEIWPKSARCIVRVSHAPGVFNEITKALMDCNASIIVSDASRSAHSYDTWRLIISCDNINANKKTYLKNKRQFKGMLSELKKIKNTIEERCDGFLFRDPCDREKREPVVCTPHNAMAFFYAMSNYPELRAKSNKYKEWAICKPFLMKRQTDGSIKPIDKEFSAILEDLNKSSNGDILPSYCFAESQSDDMSMRLVVIPKSRERLFYKLNVGFNRSGNPYTSMGWVNYVLENICENAKVWAINNKTMRFSETREEGEAEFLVEGISNMDNIERISRLKEKISVNNLPNYLSSITNVMINCEALSGAYLKQEIYDQERQALKNDIFISYSNTDITNAERLELFLKRQGMICFLSGKNNHKGPNNSSIQLGQDYRDAIKNELLSSKIIILLCTPDSVNSKWVLKELGAAWIMCKPVIPVVLNMKVEDVSEEIIKFKQAVYYQNAIDNINFINDIKNIINDISSEIRIPRWR